MQESAAPVPPPPLPALCWACARRIDGLDRYCRHCGAGQGDHVPWYYQSWGIAVSTLFGLGPFSLILVWHSPRLSAPERWAWTFGILAVSAWLAWRFYGLLQMMNFVFRSAMQGL